MHAAAMPSSARLTQVCSSTSVRMWHNASGRLGVHSRMRGAASCQQDAAGCDRSAAGSVRCSAAAQTYASVAPPAFSAPPESQTTTFDLACPICADTKFELHADRAQEPLHCSRCARTFNTDRGSFVDLTLTSGVTQRVYKESLWGGVEIFRNPLVSFFYERGWRQGFAWAGFPGVDKEFDMAMDLLRPAHGGVLVDMSCGSGIFSRRFASSQQYAGVIAADYSESMLKQTQQTFDDDGFVNDGSVLLLRADVGRLPFATGSVAAIHAGAAIHCWPNPTTAMAEISRVLRPGGVFVASTFLKAAAPLGQVFGDDAVRFLNQFDPSSAGSGKNYRWWEEGELRELASTVGLVDFQRQRSMRFIMFSASKPAAAAAGDS